MLLYVYIFTLILNLNLLKLREDSKYKDITQHLRMLITFRARLNITAFIRL